MGRSRAAAGSRIFVAAIKFWPRSAIGAGLEPHSPDAAGASSILSTVFAVERGWDQAVPRRASVRTSPAAMLQLRTPRRLPFLAQAELETKAIRVALLVGQRPCPHEFEPDRTCPWRVCRHIERSRVGWHVSRRDNQPDGIELAVGEEPRREVRESEVIARHEIRGALEPRLTDGQQWPRLVAESLKLGQKSHRWSAQLSISLQRITLSQRQLRGCAANWPSCFRQVVGTGGGSPVCGLLDKANCARGHLR